jgi:hypothetical protein
MHTYLYDEKPKEESERKNIIFSVFDSFFSLYALLFIKSNNRIARENTFTTPNPLVMVVSGKKNSLKILCMRNELHLQLIMLPKI